MDILREAFGKLQIPQEDINMYELFAMDDDRTQIEFDMTIDEVCDVLSSSSTTTIPFELMKKKGK